MKNNKVPEIGVIVGRFQINDLHEGHRKVFDTVIDIHTQVKTIVFLGVAPTRAESDNPLDFITRKWMILDSYQHVTVAPIPDYNSDEVWSSELDKRIREIHPYGSVMLYGSRDSFAKTYKGKFPITEIEEETGISATEARKEISKEVPMTSDYRSGVINCANNQFAKVFPTVDVAIICGNGSKEDPFTLLLGKKPHEEKYRFIGGFADPTDNSYEQSAIREADEETGLEVGDLKYLGSAKIDDWRYRKSQNKIITHLFVAKKVFGNEMPDDDIRELAKFEFNLLNINMFVEEHKILYLLFEEKYLNKIKTDKK